MSVVFAVLGAVVLSAVVGGVAVMIRRTPRPALAPPDNTVRDGMNLQVRDIVTHLDRDYLVVGKISFEEAGRRWYAYRLQDGVRLRWLRAMRADEVELCLVDELNTPGAVGSAPEEVTIGHVSYRLSGQGNAKAIHEGKTGWDEVGRAAWYTYVGPADHRLFVERWAGTVWACAGQQVETEECTYLPGDLVEEYGG